LSGSQLIYLTSQVGHQVRAFFRSQQLSVFATMLLTLFPAKRTTPRRRWATLLVVLLTVSFWSFSCAVSDTATNPRTANKETPSVPSSTNDGDAPNGAADFTLSLSVIDLTSQNFARSVSDGNVWLIEFYTPWCSHCQTFMASYMSIAHSFHSSPNEKIRVARVDCSVERALLSRFDVKGFPSFFVVAGWQVYEFEGTRHEANLMTFARGGYKKQDVSTSFVVLLCVLCVFDSLLHPQPSCMAEVCCFTNTMPTLHYCRLHFNLVQLCSPFHSFHHRWAPWVCYKGR
jgi:thiol-disulfide isomerase/thioredoxin